MLIQSDVGVTVESLEWILMLCNFGITRLNFATLVGSCGSMEAALYPLKVPSPPPKNTPNSPLKGWG